MNGKRKDVLDEEGAGTCFVGTCRANAATLDLVVVCSVHFPLYNVSGLSPQTSSFGSQARRGPDFRCFVKSPSVTPN